MLDEPTNPEAPEVDDVPVDATETDTPELDEYGNPVEQAPEPGPEPEDDSEEIEYEGAKYRIPKALKDGFLMQADYTRKTQELASKRQLFEAEREQFRQVSGAEVNARANIIAIDQALADYEKIDWRTWFSSDPQEAQAARLDFEELKERRNQAVGTYQKAQKDREAQEQQETARRLQQGQAELARDIPGWGQERAAAILNFGQKHFGFTADELNSISDPRAIKVLNAAFEAHEASTKRKAEEAIQAKQAIKPAAKVGGGGQPPRPLDDRASTEAWMKARSAQIAKR